MSTSHRILSENQPGNVGHNGVPGKSHCFSVNGSDELINKGGFSISLLVVKIDNEVCPPLISGNLSPSLWIGSGYLLMTEVHNNVYKNSSFVGHGKKEVRDSMTT